MAGCGHLLHRLEKVAAGIGHQRRARRIEPSAILQFVLRIEAEEVGRALGAIGAADQGDALAQYNIAVMYRDGISVLQDYAAALKGFRLAADQGLPAAQSNLGHMYSKAQGVPQNYAEALRWYRLAANKGLAEAQHNLGFMYAVGRGVSKDLVSAYMWFSLSASQGEQNAVKNRDKAAGLMTPRRSPRRRS